MQKKVFILGPLGGRVKFRPVNWQKDGGVGKKNRKKENETELLSQYVHIGGHLPERSPMISGAWWASNRWVRQRFSNYHASEFSGGLVKTDCWLQAQSFWSSRYGVELRICISNKFPGDANAPVWGSHLENTWVMAMAAKGARDGVFSLLAGISGSHSTEFGTLILFLPLFAAVPEMIDYIWQEVKCMQWSLKVRQDDLCAFIYYFSWTLIVNLLQRAVVATRTLFSLP